MISLRTSSHQQLTERANGILRALSGSLYSSIHSWKCDLIHFSAYKRIAAAKQKNQSTTNRLPLKKSLSKREGTWVEPQLYDELNYAICVFLSLKCG